MDEHIGDAFPTTYRHRHPPPTTHTHTHTHTLSHSISVFSFGKSCFGIFGLVIRGETKKRTSERLLVLTVLRF